MLNLPIKSRICFGMELRITFVLLTTTVFLLFAPSVLFAEDQDSQLVEAIKMYDRGQYVEAEKLLKPLLEKNPDHLMVNYFYGACRTENQHYGSKEIIYLLKGSTGESPLKTDYYLAVQYHAQNRWEEALSHYQSFQNQSTAEEQQELQLALKIEQCEDHINPFVSADETSVDIAPVPLPKTTEADTLTTSVEPVYPEMDSMESDALSSDAPISQSISAEEQNSTAPTVFIDFEVNSDMTYIDTANFQTEDGLSNYLKWKEASEQLDSLQEQTDQWRSDYAKARTSTERNRLGEQIIGAEQELFDLQLAVREHRRLAVNAENDYWDSLPETERITFADDLRNQTQTLHNKKESKTTIPDTAIIIPVEALENLNIASVEQEDETGDELVYKIQIGAYSRGLPSYVKNKFDKLSYIRKIENYTDDRGVVVYTTGNLTNLQDAVKMQNQVRQEGIEDAFVVPYFNGKRITLEEAKKLEGER